METTRLEGSPDTVSAGKRGNVILELTASGLGPDEIRAFETRSLKFRFRFRRNQCRAAIVISVQSAARKGDAIVLFFHVYTFFYLTRSFLSSLPSIE